MPKFESDSFNKNFPSAVNQKQMREFTVGSPENAPTNENFIAQPLPQQPVMRQISPAELEQARRNVMAEKSPQDRINEQAKKRLEILAGIGSLTKDVSIGGTTFSLRTLKAKETKEAALATFASVGTQLEASYEARVQQLARSIYKIDGNSIDDVLGTNDIASRITKIENFEEILINRLWDDFVALKEESNTKYGVNTEAEAKEVSEDLKKL